MNFLNFDQRSRIGFLLSCSPNRGMAFFVRCDHCSYFVVLYRFDRGAPLSFSILCFFVLLLLMYASPDTRTKLRADVIAQPQPM